MLCGKNVSIERWLSLSESCKKSILTLTLTYSIKKTDSFTEDSFFSLKRCKKLQTLLCYCIKKKK